MGSRAVVIGTAEIRLRLMDSRSLKQKRSTMNALKDRLRNKFNVSVAEVDDQEFIRGATLAVTQVSSDRRYLNSSLDKAVDAVRAFPAADIVDYHLSIL